MLKIFYFKNKITMVSNEDADGFVRIRGKSLENAERRFFRLHPKHGEPGEDQVKVFDENYERISIVNRWEANRYVTKIVDVLSGKYNKIKDRETRREIMKFKLNDNNKTYIIKANYITEIIDELKRLNIKKLTLNIYIGGQALGYIDIANKDFFYYKETFVPQVAMVIDPKVTREQLQELAEVLNIDDLMEELNNIQHVDSSYITVF